MKIKSVQIKNYRSIEDVILKIDPLDDNSLSYGLIGVNEAGKSSVLKALALKERLVEVDPKDFRGNNPIQIIYTLAPTEEEINEYKKLSNEETPAINLKDIDFKVVTCIFYIVRTNPSERNLVISIKEEKNDDVKKLEEKLFSLITSRIPKAIFWTAESRYLIDKPINKSDFSSSPDTISIPLKNCFALAGINDIHQHITNLSGTPAEEELENVLGEKVTEHIKMVWPNHPIQITFRIAENLINFHVKDEGANVKAKTADQRSDGFKQFVSFLLTISAQSKNEQLSDSILLLDEPETHLHPKAQEYLLNELIKITKGDKNNICFFATHSLFMIDKNDLSRNIKVFKESDKTDLESFSNKKSSYSRVAYEVYGIPTTDFHNELYGMLQAREDKNTEKEFDAYLVTKGLESHLPYIKLKKDSTTETYNVTLPVKVRNIIHHPENPNNSYNSDDLKKSIDLLLSC